MKKSEIQQLIREEISTTVNESPDEWLDANGRFINWRDGDPVVFGYFDDVMYTSLEPDDYWQKRNRPWTHALLGRWIEDQIDEGKIPQPVGWPDQYIDREAFKYAGRLWIDKMVISFWDYPKNAKDLDKTINDINKKIGPKYKINDDWEIDLGFTEDGSSSKLAQISSYKSSKEAKPEDPGKAHIAFGKHGNVPAGVGSKFKHKNQQPGETVAQMRDRLKTSENKSNKMKKSELQEIIREEISKVLKEAELVNGSELTKKSFSEIFKESGLNPAHIFRFYKNPSKSTVSFNIMLVVQGGARTKEKAVSKDAAKILGDKLKELGASNITISEHEIRFSMKKSELQDNIREEISKVIKESAIDRVFKLGDHVKYFHAGLNKSLTGRVTDVNDPIDGEYTYTIKRDGSTDYHEGIRQTDISPNLDR